MKAKKPQKKPAGPFVRWFRRHSLEFTLVLLGFLFLVFYLWNYIFFDIESGQSGVVWKRFAGGTYLDKTYGEGIQVIWPWDKMYIYDIRIQKVEGEIVLLASNGLSLEVKFATRFSPNAEFLPELHMKYGPDYQEKIIRPEVISALRRILGNYNHEDIYARDEAGLLDDITEEVRKNINENYISFNDVMLTMLKLPVKLDASITDKLTEEQKFLAYEFIVARERQELVRRAIEGYGIQFFENTSGISILKWRGIEATENLAASPNAKFIVIGNDSDSLPVILNMDK